MYGMPKPKQEARGGMAMLGLRSLANYVASGLVKPGEHMHEEIALQLARRLNKEGENGS